MQNEPQNQQAAQQPSQEAPQEAQSKQSAPKKAAGNYLFKQDEIPVEVKAFINNRLGNDANGNPITNDKNEPAKINIFPAKEGGTYKGTVILNNADFVVQSVGTGQTAVVHRKSDVELQGKPLQNRDQSNSLHGADIQVFYTKDKAKAYPWNKEKDLEKKSEPGLGEKPKPAQEVSPELKAAYQKQAVNDVLAKALEYAEQNIKNTNQRTAFIKHINAAVGAEKTTEHSSEAPEKAQAQDQQQAPAER